MPKERSSAKPPIQSTKLVILLGAPSAVGAVIALFGGLHWIAELLTHFRVQNFWALLLCALYLAVARRFRWAAAYCVPAMVSLAAVLPLYFGQSPDAGQPADLCVMLMNVNQQTGDSARVMEAIEHFQPDVVLFQEVDEAWLERPDRVSEDYPFRLTEPRNDNFGIALLSRLPLRDSRVAYFGDSGVPSTVARIECGTQALSFIGTHPPPPGSAEYLRMRNVQIEGVAKAVREMQKPVIVLGDLNTTPWSPVFRQFLTQARLANSARGWDVQATWPVDLMPLRVPLDHCLHSEKLQVARREIGPDVGSDHFPLVVDFVFDEATDE